MQVRSIIEEVKDHRQQPRKTQIKGIAIHRCGVNHAAGIAIGYDAETICDAFVGRNPGWPDVTRATGGQNAYTFYVGGNCGPAEYDGVIWQALPIWETGHHARRFSAPFLGVACIGDFRPRYDRDPSESQKDALCWLVGRLALTFGLNNNAIYGHGEIRGAHGGEKAPGQPAACPGRLLSVTSVRLAAYELSGKIDGAEAKAQLFSAGVVF